MQVEKLADLSKKTSFGIGGKACLCLYPENIEDLIYCRTFHSDATIISGGTNILVNDEVDLYCIISMSKFLKRTNITGDCIKYVTVEAGMGTQELVNFLVEERITGLEFLCGIPGLIGGAVIMNAGSVGRSISEAIYSVTVIDEDGDIKILSKDLHRDDLKFRRRYSILQDKNYVVVAVTFALMKDHRYAIRDKIDFYKARREDLPKGKSAGGIFVNHHILRKYQLDGLAVGDAYLDGNFIVNRGNATAQDVLNLIEEVKSRVKEELKLEIKLIGF